MSEYLLLGKTVGKASVSAWMKILVSSLSRSFQWYQRKLIVIIIIEKGAEQNRVIILYLRFVYLVNGEQNHQQHHRSFPGASL